MGGVMANEGLSVRDRLANWRERAMLKPPRGGAPSYRLLEHEVEGLLDENERAWAAYEVSRQRFVDMCDARDSLATRLEAAKGEASRLEKEKRDHEVTIATLRGSIDALSTERVEMSRTIESKQSYIDLVVAERDQLRAALRAEMARLSTTAPNPGARTFAHENRRLREELESARAALESLSKAGETLSETAARLSRENEALTSVNRDFREEVRLLTTERDMARDQERQWSGNRRSMRRALDQAREEIQEVLRERDTLHEALSAAEKKAADHHWKDCLPDDVPVIQNFHVYGPIQAKEGAEPGLARYCDFWNGPFVRRGDGIVLNARSTYATGGVVEGSAPLVAGGGACTYPAPVFPAVTVKREGPRFEKTEQVAASGRRGGKSKARNKAVAAWVAQWIESGNPRLVLERGEGTITARVEWPT